MNVTIPLGWWIVPLLFTSLALLWSSRRIKQVTSTSRGDFSGIGDLMVAVFYGGGALIAILVAWLIYFMVF